MQASPLPLPQVAAAPGPVPSQAPSKVGTRLLDAHGRTIGDLRLSVTDRCNFRCTYCMEEDERFAPRQSLLGLDDYLKIVDAAIDLGVTKVRITGGEPTLYPELNAFIEALGMRPLDDIAMTTNGWRLTDAQATRWRQDGLHRLTFSLDTLRHDRMKAITRSTTSIDTVLASTETARRAGFPRPKVNVVMQRGVNDDEGPAFAQLARDRNLDVRFIEFMPLDAGHNWRRDDVFTADETLASIEAHFDLVPAQFGHAAETSVNFAFGDGAPGRLGFIAPVSRPFCGACNRLRVTAEGMVRPCLFSNKEWDLRPALRSNQPKAVHRFLQDATWTKQAGHEVGKEGFVQPKRGMRAIGG